MKAPITKALVAGLSLAFAGMAQAAPITTWNLVVNSTFFQSSVQPAPPNVTYVSSTELRWGTPAVQGGSDSGLIIGNTPANTFVDTNGLSIVPNVTITHRNNPIFAPSLTSVDIESVLTLTPFDPSGTGLPDATQVFKVTFLETPNTPPLVNGVRTCADGTLHGVGLNIDGCADIFITDRNTINFPFFYDDVDYDSNLTEAQNLANGAIKNRPYFISFLEVTSGLNPLPAQACTEAGATAPCLGFRTPEQATTTVQFGALITTDPVSIPEPGTLGLLGIALTGLALARRRKI